MRKPIQGKLNYASVGPGSSSHLNGELLKSLAGIDIVHIPFNGSPPAVTSTVQGETQMLFAVMQPLQPQIQAGKLRATGGVVGQALPVAARSADDRGERLSEFRGASLERRARPGRRRRSPSSRASTRRSTRSSSSPTSCRSSTPSGFDLVGGTPEQFAALIKGESEKWAPIIKAANIKID